MPVEDDLPASILDAGLLEQRRQRRAGPGGVAHQPAGEREPVVAGAFDGKGDLLAWTRFDLIECQAQRLLDQAGDVEVPRLQVDGRLAEVLDREELLVRGDPGVQLFPN